MSSNGRAADRDLRAAVARDAIPLDDEAEGWGPLLERVAGAQLVLLGEATHGTHEFYRGRAEITKRLIKEAGFVAVAVEADWPDALRVNRYVRGTSDDPDADRALAGFERFPSWMWRNAVVREFADWLRARNDSVRGRAPKAGFYGLDLYSLRTSIEAVVRYLDRVDLAAARRARDRYSCFETFGEDTQSYGYAAGFGLAKSCEDEVVGQLGELQRLAGEYARRDGQVAEDEYFYAEQNARLARNAERYYRAMFRGRAESWNLRDRHMAESLEALLGHLGRAGGRPKVVVWAHNSHLGDARATEMGEGGELNLGQLARERYGDAAYLVGFTTYEGTVTAAPDWGLPPGRKRVVPALPGSCEALFHDASPGRFLLDFRAGSASAKALRGPLLERAIGVVYRPRTERQSHYFHVRLTEQFDAVIHIDRTGAVVPLEVVAGWGAGEAPETFPSAL